MSNKRRAGRNKTPQASLPVSEIGLLLVPYRTCNFSGAAHLFREGLKVELGGEVEARVDLLRLEGVEVHLEPVQVQHHVRRKLP